MAGTMKPVPVVEAALSVGGGVDGVDRENKILRGFIVAELGPFKTPGRGEFDKAGLQKIVELGNAKSIGLKSRFTHPGLSSDALGNYLGRVRNFRMDGDTKVRADLHFDPSAFTGPKGNLAQYVMDLGESDPLAIGSSLVIEPKKEFRLNADGTRMKSADGKELPPLWHPQRLFASDIVDEGDATNSLLSVEDLDELPDAAVRLAFEALNRAFAGQDRLTTETRAKAFLERYLNDRFGGAAESQDQSAGLSLSAAQRKLKLYGHALACDA